MPSWWQGRAGRCGRGGNSSEGSGGRDGPAPCCCARTAQPSVPPTRAVQAPSFGTSTTCELCRAHALLNPTPLLRPRQTFVCMMVQVAYLLREQ